MLLTRVGQKPELGSLPDSDVITLLSKPVRQQRLRAALKTALGPSTASDARENAPPAMTKPEQPRLGRLLLAEDNLVNQVVAVAMLTSVGYQVDTAIDGVDAVTAAKKRRYDAILMDCQMPNLDGYEATAAIRASEGRIRHTPIVAMTAGARQEDRDLCAASGMDAYLSKPVDKATLLAKVAELIRNGPNETLALVR